MADIVKKPEYRNWLRDLKLQIKTGQVKAAFSVNSQMIILYWDLGRQIIEKQEAVKWGSGFIEQLSMDLRKEFPDITGFSKDNLLMMKRFYMFYQPDICETFEFVAQPVQQLQLFENQEDTIVAQPVQELENQSNIEERFVLKLALIPWGHHTTLLRKVKDVKRALF